MARALGTGSPEPDLASLLADVEAVRQKIVEHCYRRNDPDGEDIWALGWLLRAISTLIRQGRDPGMMLRFGGVTEGKGFSLAVVPKKARREEGEVVPFVPPQRRRLGVAACRALPPKGGDR